MTYQVYFIMDKLNIQLKTKEKLWFTSDCHFGHRNVLKFCDRPYKDEKEMGQAIINNWNSVVKPDEKIFCLGDFSWWDGRHEIKKIISKLNGEIFLVPGNHDRVRSFELCDPGKLHICSDVVYLYVRPAIQNTDSRFATGCYEVVLSHFPQLCYSHSDKKNVYNFFGHIHSLKGQPMVEFGEPIKLRPGRQIDVGMDRHDYTPVEFFQVLKEIKEYPYWDMH